MQDLPLQYDEMRVGALWLIAYCSNQKPIIVEDVLQQQQQQQQFNKPFCCDKLQPHLDRKISLELVFTNFMKRKQIVQLFARKIFLKK